MSTITTTPTSTTTTTPTKIKLKFKPKPLPEEPLPLPLPEEPLPLLLPLPLPLLLPLLEESNNIKGKRYETQILEILSLESDAWIWNQIPIKILKQYGIISCYSQKRQLLFEGETNDTQDLGCDILLIRNDKPIIVQCKNYIKKVSPNDLAGFYRMINGTGLKGELYCTNGVTKNFNVFKNDPKCFVVPYKVHNEVHKDLIELYDYQKIALEELKNEHKCTLSLPCGMGKTHVAIEWSKHSKIIIVFSPLIASTCLTGKRFEKILKRKYYEIHSDAYRIIPNNSKSESIITCTYDSCDIVLKWLDKLPNYDDISIIIDEFHNLPYNAFDNDDNDDNDVDDDYDYDYSEGDEDDAGQSEDDKDHIDEDNEDHSKDNYSDDVSRDIRISETSNISSTSETSNNFKNLFKKNIRTMFLSATPKIYDIDNELLDTTNITGKEYTYTLGDAIKNKYVCDYMVYVPIKHTITSINNKIDYILRCMDENGHSKCIVYLNSQSECDEFKELLSNNNYFKNIYVDIITHKTSQKDRDEIIREFSNTIVKALILSIRILDEAIDIVECDSIFIANPSRSINEIRCIQRMCRANRLCKRRPDKVSGIYLWCDEYDEISQFIINLKEYDSTFTTLKVTLIDKDHKDNCISNNIEEIKNLENVIENKCKRVQIWDENLIELVNFIEKNDKRPSTHSKIKKESNLSNWYHNQKKNYKNKLNIMKNLIFYDKWTNFINNYRKYFPIKIKSDLDKEWEKLIFEDKIKNVRDFINEYKYKPKDNPDKTSKDILYERKLAKFLSHTRTNYNKKLLDKNDLLIYEILISEFNYLFNHYSDFDFEWTNLSFENKSVYSYNWTKTLFKRANPNSEDEIESKIGNFFSYLITKYNKHLCNEKEMEYNELIYFKKIINDFPSLYNKKTYFDIKWQKMISKDKYIYLQNWIYNNNNKFPDKNSEISIEKKLGNFFGYQKTKYNKHLNGKKIMEEEELITHKTLINCIKK